MVKRARPPVDVLWCGNSRTGRSNGWSYPPRVERHLRELTAGKTVLQQFGGLSKWGTKIDIDPVTRPHVLGDAWLLPFVQNAFDVVIIDPPYHSINQQMKQALLRAAAFVARERVIWFHTQWVASDSHLTLERSWLVRVGDSCACRCIQVFRSPAVKKKPATWFTRGPAVKYNRWLIGQTGLPFERGKKTETRM